MSTNGDGLFFAGLLDFLGQWWEEMGPLGQILFTAWAVSLLLAMGGSFGLALGAAGVLTWVLGHGRGLAAFLRDPRTATHLDEMAELFTKHTDITAAWHADKARFTEIAAQYDINVTSFGNDNLQAIIGDIAKKGANQRTLSRLDELSESIHTGGVEVRRVAEQVGEQGGRHSLAVEGYHTPQAFRTPPNGRGPGPFHVDDLAVSASGDEVVIAEYKGGQSRYRPNTTYPLRELDPSMRAAQGSPDYVMDRMLSDERVIQHFHDHPGLWQSIKEGRTSLRTDVYQTPIPGETSLAHSESFSPSPDFITKMGHKIANLR